jgi:hypothetical protein
MTVSVTRDLTVSGAGSTVVLKGSGSLAEVSSCASAALLCSSVTSEPNSEDGDSGGSVSVD